MILPKRYKTLTKGQLAGGFGTIIPLEDNFLRRVVLLKVMQDAANNSQLQNEIKALCGARSRHVIEVYDILFNDKLQISGIIIERLRGREFSQFFIEAKANANSYLKVIYQITCALRDLHEAGIIHRDLKLDNFRESASGVVKLFDFGISSLEGGYKTKENKGTLIYAAPELYQPNALITPEMDIYALGICAWALASQQFPVELRERPPQQSGRAPSIASVMPTSAEHPMGLHPEVVEILDSCLSPVPAERPTAAKICARLAHHLIRDRHRGLFVQHNSPVVELSAHQRTAILKIRELGEIKVTYDGLRFFADPISGNVRINNIPVTPGAELHEACLLSFGDPSLGSSQQWVTFFASHPEVVL